MRLLKHISRLSIISTLRLTTVMVLCLAFPVVAWQSNFSLSPQVNAPRTSVSTAREYAFVRIGLEQGLSQSSVYALAQDKRGFLWIGTQDGLNKYDGYHFTAFRNNSSSNLLSGGMRGSLPNGWITQIIRDRFDNLWVGSNGGGLAHIHHDSNRAELLPMLTDARSVAQTSATSVLRSGFVTALTADDRGRLWIGTDRGLHCIDTLKPSYSHASGSRLANPRLSDTRLPAIRIRYIPASFTDNASRQALSQNITALAHDRLGRVWIATQTGFFCYTPAATLLKESIKEVALPTDGKTTTLVQSLFIDSLGRIWIGTLGKGLMLYNPATGYLRSFPVESRRNDAPHRTNILSGRSVYCFATDERGFLWVGTDNGVNILSRPIQKMPDDADVEIAICRSVPQMTTSVADNAVRSLICDASGTMWIGTLTAGMSAWNPLRQSLGAYSPDKGNAPFLPYRVVRSFHEESDSVLWVGTDEGLVQWNYRNGNFTQMLIATKDGTGLQSGRVWAIERDSSGILWFGTDGGGLHRYEAQKRRFTVYRHELGDSTSLCNDRVRTITFDNGGGMWIGTLLGLDYLPPYSSVFKHFQHDPQNLQSLSNDRIQSILCDADSVVWIATALGLNRFDRKHGVWKRYFHDSTATSLPNSWVKHIMRDHDGTMWLSTVSGICRFNPQNDNFSSYGTQNGLGNEYVYGIVEDAKGFLWMGTDKGLARFDKQNNIFRMYEAADGLQSNEFNTNAFYRLRDGTLVFGGVNGMNMFRPDLIGERFFMPTVVLTAVKISNAARSFDTDVSALSELVLSYRDRLVELDFAALDFANIERVQYAYMLEGVDKEFVSFGTRNFATYTNLPAGEYTFRVRATNAAGVWNAHELSLRVVVVPPFWETWYFRTGLMLLFCGFIWGGVQIRLRGIARRNSLLKEEVRKRTQQLEQSNQELAWSNERLNDLNNEKNAILGIAAHDLQTPLATILTLTELVENDRDTLSREELYHFSSLMRQSATRMMGLITQLLNMNMIDEGKLNLAPEVLEVNTLVASLVADAQAIARPKNLHLHYTKPQEQYYVHADQNAYLQIIENLLSNAVKYSPLSKNIFVELAPIEREKGEYICCTIRDEGNGLTDDDKKRLFGKFARLSSRPTGGEHSTGLGLSIVKKLVEAMDGEIWCESEHRKGAAFSVAFARLPAPAPSDGDQTASPKLS